MVRLGIHVGSAAVVHTLLNVPHTHTNTWLHDYAHTHTHAKHAQIHTQTQGFIVVSICLISCITQICNAVKTFFIYADTKQYVVCTCIVDATEYQLCVIHVCKSFSDHIYMGSPYDLFIVRGRRRSLSSDTKIIGWTIHYEPFRSLDD